MKSDSPTRGAGAKYKTPIQIIADAKTTLTDHSLPKHKPPQTYFLPKNLNTSKTSTHDKILHKINDNMINLAPLTNQSRKCGANPQNQDDILSVQGGSRDFVIRTRKSSESSRIVKTHEYDDINELPTEEGAKQGLNHSNSSHGLVEGKAKAGFKIKPMKLNVTMPKPRSSEEKTRSFSSRRLSYRKQVSVEVEPENKVTENPTGSEKNPSTPISKSSPEEEKIDPKEQKANPQPSDQSQNNHPVDSVAVIEAKLGDVIGEGAYGEVYRALNKKTGTFIAVKVVKMTGDLSHSQFDMKIHNKEIMLLQQLSHPQIVHYFGFKHEADIVHIYMELMTGGSISSRLKQYGPLDEKIIRKFTYQILLGLQYLHSKGVIHRDLKGANILSDNYGNIKLADFGAAHYIINQPLLTASTSEMCKSMKGSLYWMAPEVLNQNNHGKSVDIWSLGCSIIEMASGVHPWEKCSTFTEFLTMVAKLRCPPIPDHLSPEAKDFLQLCLRWNPKERPAASNLLLHPFVTNGRKEHST